MEKTEIHTAAIAEVLNPTLALTKQFLVVHKVVMKGNRPLIADVILQKEEQIAEVYFPIEGENYYFVVYLNVEQLHVSVRRVGMSAGNRVYFSATAEEHGLNELIALVNIEPTRTWTAGSKRARLPRHNGFEVEPCVKKTGDVEIKLHKLLDILLPHKADIHALSAAASIGINIVYWGCTEQMGGLFLDKETIQHLAALELSIDVDIYAGKTDEID